MEQEKGTEDEENDEFDRWLNDEAQFGPQQEKEVTVEEQPFDTNIFLQSPSRSLLHLSSSTKKTPSEKLPLPKDSPPKDPTPPAASSSSHNESSSES